MASDPPRAAGLPFPLGATWDGSGVNVAVFSANATRIELCLFDADGRARDRPDRAAGVHPRGLARLLPRPAPGPALRAARARALCARGRAPVQPEQAAARPLRRALTGEIRWHDSLYGYRIGSRAEDLSFDRRDSARAMPKCQIVDPAHTWGADRPPQRPGRRR